MITFFCEGNSKIEVSKSVFIGNAKEVTSAEEAEAFVADIRAKYPDARHVCYAWRTEGETFMQKYSDDGEPSGTAGMPILNVLDQKGITNGVVTVTRYFGGILLGKGGLVRAYTDCAAEAVKDAGLVRVSEGSVFEITAGYDMAEKLIYALRQDDWMVESPIYGESVSFKVTVLKEKGDLLKSFVTDRTAGRIMPEKLSDTLIREQIKNDE